MNKIYKYKSLLDGECEENIRINPFLISSNLSRYNAYLNDTLFKYITDTKRVYECLDEVDIPDHKEFYGIFDNDKRVSCVIPKKNTLYDEMISIHEITHLLNVLFSNNHIKGDLRETIPFFNEYNYLMQIDKELANHYSQFRKQIANNYLNKCPKNVREYLCYVKGSLILEKRKYSYDIDELNEINVSKDSKKELILKGYTM